MNPISDTYSLLFLKAFKERQDDALVPIQERFKDTKVIGISVTPAKIKVGIIQVHANGSRTVSNVQTFNADGYPDSVLPASVSSALAKLVKLQNVVVTYSDSSLGALKTMSGDKEDTEEASLISMSADPEGIISGLPSRDVHRVIHGPKSASIIGSMPKNMVSLIREQCENHKLTLCRISFTPLAAFDILLSQEAVDKKRAIPVVFDSGSAYIVKPEKRKHWGQVRTIKDCVGSYYIDDEDGEMLGSTLPRALINDVTEGTPVLAIDTGNSGTIEIPKGLDITFVDGFGPSIDNHTDLIASTLN